MASSTPFGGAPCASEPAIDKPNPMITRTEVDIVVDHHVSPALRSHPVATWFRSLGPQERPLFGHYNPGSFKPGVGGVRPLGIVMCAPFGSEMMCTHRSYRHLAAQLSAAGFPVLRF